MLVAGLGNPGPRYADTRHNVGFLFADRLARTCGGGFRRQGRLLGELAEVRCHGQAVRLLKPETFMNHSGRAVGAVARYYGLEPAQILVVHDDLDLPPGTARLKRGGGHGGHNGLRDIIAHLGSREFVRLRLGIGHPGRGEDVVAYVLSRAGKQERSAIDEAIENALGVMPRVLDGELDSAMNRLHGQAAPT